MGEGGFGVVVERAEVGAANGVVEQEEAVKLYLEWSLGFGLRTLYCDAMAYLDLELARVVDWRRVGTGIVAESLCGKIGYTFAKGLLF